MQRYLLQNIAYGSNGNCLDVYFPMEEAVKKDEFHRPVVVFIYGGSWGSGDKSMYGLLASQLADNLSAVVICPNYSIYPKVFTIFMFVLTVAFTYLLTLLLVRKGIQFESKPASDFN